MKRRRVIYLCLVLSLIPLSQGFAVTDVAHIDTLVVDLWPDYDRASVLVMLTGTLPGDRSLPARVSLPFPASAQLNAVARIDSRDGQMKDDVLSSPGIGELSLIIPDPSFRVEYYQPYTVSDKQHAFAFSWQSGLSIKRFQLRIQQPSAATAFRTLPAAGQVAPNAAGLMVHTFPVQTVPAGQAFTVRLDYTMSRPQLSVQRLPSSNPAPPPSTGPVDTSGGPGINWPFLAILAGSVLMVLAIIWMAVSRRAASRKAAPVDVEKPVSAIFERCPHCGHPAGDMDQFCASCGERLSG